MPLISPARKTTTRASSSSSTASKRTKAKATTRKDAGEWVRELRLRAGLSQIEIGAHLKTNASFVSLIESGRAALPIDRSPAYANALGVRVRPFVLKVLRFYHPAVAEALSASKS